MNYGVTHGGGGMDENLYPSVTTKVGKLFIDPRQESTDGGHSWSLSLFGLCFVWEKEFEVLQAQHGSQTHSAAYQLFGQTIQSNKKIWTSCLHDRLSFKPPAVPANTWHTATKA